MAVFRAAARQGAHRPGLRAAILLLALLTIFNKAESGRFVEPPGQAKVVDGEFIAIFEDGVPDVASRAKGLVRKYSGIDMTSGVWDIVKGFSFR